MSDWRAERSKAARSSRASAPSSRWFCSGCTTVNLAEHAQCLNPRCLLSRKVVGVDLPDDRTDPVGEATAGSAADSSGAVLTEYTRVSRYGGETVGIASRPPSFVLAKRKRCGECEGCKQPDCGRCEFCRDMKKFGGKNIKRQTCVNRKCIVLVEENEEANEKKEEERELRAEQKEAARLERNNRLEEEKRLKLEEREEARAAREAEKLREAQERRERREERREQAAANRPPRVPRPPRLGAAATALLPVLPTDPAAFGWGAAPADLLVAGAEAEVVGVDDGLKGACFRARVAEPPSGGAAVPPPSGGGAAADLTSSSEGGAGAGAEGGGGGGGVVAAVAPPPRGQLARIEYFDLLETDEPDSALLREWVDLSNVRLAPPPTPDGFLGLVRACLPPAALLLRSNPWHGRPIPAASSLPPRDGRCVRATGSPFCSTTVGGM
jgi:hypothetical protein